MPVGRITYRFVEPLNFAEYLTAHGQTQLLNSLAAWTSDQKLGPLTHQKATEFYERYSMVGGMPAVVAADASGATPQACRRLQTDLIATYRDDFAKYTGRINPSRLDVVLVSAAAQLGDKFVYARASEQFKQTETKACLELLAKARLLTLIPHTSADGIPLAGTSDPRKRKAMFLDIGLAHAILRTPARQSFPSRGDLAPGMRGKLAEQLAAQQLRTLEPAQGFEPTLHYWQRSGGRPGEIDFLIEVDQIITPVEIKSGASGAMKSLHQFMHDRNLAKALRIDTNPPSLMYVDVKTTQSQPSRYWLLSLPGYLLWRAQDLLRQ